MSATAPVAAKTAASPNGAHLPFDASGIPDELKQMPQWVLWRHEGRGKKRTKVPYQPSGKTASSADPGTWCAFRRALAAASRFDGIGFMFANGIVGVDLDHCIDAAGQPSDLAADVLSRLHTYTEVSPSGHGFHFLARGQLPGDGFKKPHAEMYDTKRFFTITGQRWPGTLATVEECDDVLAELYDELSEDPNPFEDRVSAAISLDGQDPAAADWLVQDFIERGDLVLLNAAAGLMKSLLALYLFVCVAAGRKFLTRKDGSGGLATKQTPVFWLNSDNLERTHTERLIAILRPLGDFNIPFYWLTTTDFELTQAKHVQWLTDLITDCGAGVLVIDTLSGVLPGVEENSAKEMTTPAANLRSLTNLGLTVFVLHHPPKNDSNGSRGSSVLEGKVDRRFTLSRDGDLLTLKPAKIRGRAKPPIVAMAKLESDPTTEALTSLAFYDGRAALASAEHEKAELAILDALDAGELNTRALYRAVKLPRARVEAALASLLVARAVKLTLGPRGAKIYERV